MVSSSGDRVNGIIAELRRLADASYRDRMPRFAIPNENAFGVPVPKVQGLAKRLGRDPHLAVALWDTGWYEARLLTAYVADPQRLAVSQMNRWCREFDSWAICDNFCFHLFDKTPHAFGRVAAWARQKPEFEKRAAFALLASLACHDKQSPDGAFLECFPLLEAASTDPRNFVKKGVSWALRFVGHRNGSLKQEALALARRLEASSDRTQRWIGKDAIRDLTRTARS